jgi:hypothetical protein
MLARRYVKAFLFLHLFEAGIELFSQPRNFAVAGKITALKVS